MPVESMQSNPELLECIAAGKLSICFEPAITILSSKEQQSPTL